MKIISKALVGAVAAGAMAVVPTAAASAQYRHYERDRGISVGDVIAGAVVIGGIAAVVGALGRDDRYRYDDRYYRDGRYDYYNGNPRLAVEQCVNAANRDARSRGYRYAQVTQVRDVNDTRYGWKIKGNLVVDGARGWDRDRRYYDRARYYDRRYDDRYYGDRYGYQRQDSGSFTCWIDRGRVSRMDYSGIRGL